MVGAVVSVCRRRRPVGGHRLDGGCTVGPLGLPDKAEGAASGMPSEQLRRNGLSAKSLWGQSSLALRTKEEESYRLGTRPSGVSKKP